MRPDFLKLMSIGVAVSFWSIGCAKAKFNEGTGAAAAASCAAQLGTITAPVKLLFVVDTSGSNASDAYSTGTDPDKSLRGGSIQQFFNDYRTAANFSWGMITFGGTSARSLIGNSASPTFSNNVSIMQSALNAFYGTVDTDLTPYEAALNMAKLAIANDTGATAQTKYIVVFLSDGYPEPAVASSTLASDVSSILALRPGQVTFNTIYYGPPAADDSARLQMMALVGSGHFLDTNNSATGKDFQISNEIAVPGSNCAI